MINKCSSIYLTEAWGNVDQPAFYNQALLVTTTLTPNALLDYCRTVTTKFPAKRSAQWGPRSIDIDIIFYENIIVDTDLLKIPHPRMHLRNFVLIPLLEIAPEYVHPQLNQTVEELYLASEDNLEVRLLETH